MAMLNAFSGWERIAEIGDEEGERRFASSNFKIFITNLLTRFKSLDNVL